MDIAEFRELVKAAWMQKPEEYFGTRDVTITEVNPGDPAPDGLEEVNQPALLVVRGDEKHLVLLHHSYRRVLLINADVETEIAILAHATRGLDDFSDLMAKPWQDVEPLLRLQIAPPGLYAADFALSRWGDFEVSPVIDSPERIIRLTPEELTFWGATLEQAVERAKTNMRQKCMPRFERQDPEQTGWPCPIWVATGVEPSYVAGSLVAAWPDLQAITTDTPVIAVPDQAVLIITEMPGGEQGLWNLAMSARVVHDRSPYPISPGLYTVVNGQPRLHAVLERDNH